MKKVAILLLLSLGGCGTMFDAVCAVHDMANALKPPSEIEKMGDAIQPKAP